MSKTQFYIAGAKNYPRGVVVNMLTDEPRLFPTREAAQGYIDLSSGGGVNRHWIDAQVKEYHA